MTLPKTGFVAVVALVAALSCGSAAAQSGGQVWDADVTPGGATVAVACGAREGGEACLRIACRADGGLRLVMTGYEARRPNAEWRDSILVDGRATSVLWRYVEGRRGAARWRAEIDEEGAFLSRLQLGRALQIGVGPASPIEIGLRGSFRAIEQVRESCAPAEETAAEEEEAAPAANAEPSTPWETDTVGRDTVIARSCVATRRRPVCAVVACSVDGDLQLAVSGLRGRRDGARRNGAVSIDGTRRDATWTYDAIGRGASRWAAVVDPGRGFIAALRRGARLTVEIGQRRRFEFGLSGSSRTLDVVAASCR